MTDELRRAKLKMAHVLRSQFNYNVGLERIDMKLDVLEPALREIDKQAAKGELPEFVPEALGE